MLVDMNLDGYSSVRAKWVHYVAVFNSLVIVGSGSVNAFANIENRVCYFATTFPC